MIRNFEDFCKKLTRCGFTLGGSNAKGIFALIDFGWQCEPENSPVRWHTGDPETDPWEWRIRVLEERSDIAYGKFFFKTSGYITREWYPHFLAVRRGKTSFEKLYEDGKIPRMAKRVYEIIDRYGEIPVHEIRRQGGFGKEDTAAFERAILELQMQMYITVCGHAQKIGKTGKPYGWNSAVLAKPETFWAARGADLPVLDPEQSFEKIREQVLTLNPNAGEKNIAKFIRG